MHDDMLVNTLEAVAWIERCLVCAVISILEIEQIGSSFGSKFLLFSFLQ